MTNGLFTAKGKRRGSPSEVLWYVYDNKNKIKEYAGDRKTAKALAVVRNRQLGSYRGRFTVISKSI